MRLDSVFGTLFPVARVLGLHDWLARIRASLPQPADADAETAVVLLKKDGTPYRAGYGGSSREIAEAVQAAQRIVGKAIVLRATDVHFEPKTGQEYQVRYRIDGVLQTRQVMSSEAGRAVVSAIKVLSDMDIAERRRPQDGTFAVCKDSSRFDVQIGRAHV